MPFRNHSLYECTHRTIREPIFIHQRASEDAASQLTARRLPQISGSIKKLKYYTKALKSAEVYRKT